MSVRLNVTNKYLTTEDKGKLKGAEFRFVTSLKHLWEEIHKLEEMSVDSTPFVVDRQSLVLGENPFVEVTKIDHMALTRRPIGSFNDQEFMRVWLAEDSAEGILLPVNTILRWEAVEA